MGRPSGCQAWHPPSCDLWGRPCCYVGPAGPKATQDGCSYGTPGAPNQSRRGPQKKKMERFNKHFEQVVRYDILYKDRFTNVMQVPKISKAFLNIGIGKKAVVDGRHILTALLALEHITGQKPVVTRAKK